MTPMLEASGLNTYYHRSHILFDVSLSVAAGQTVCLMGRNGAGKSTTFRSLMGLTPPRSGTVRFKGKDVTGAPAYRMARAGLGFVPEDRRIFAPFTVKENLELGRVPGRRGAWDFARVFEYFPVLREFSARVAGTLSGGEQQMLTIARTLMGNPDVLLLDEPSEGLSPVMVATLRDLVLRLKEAGTTILMSEQHVRFALSVSDRVVVIDKGHVRYEGTCEEFKANEEVQKKYLAV